jgi:ribosomal protein S8
MGRKRRRRAEGLRIGGNEGYRKVWVPGETDGVEKVLDRRVEEGYRRGYKRRKEVKKKEYQKGHANRQLQESRRDKRSGKSSRTKKGGHSFGKAIANQSPRERKGREVELRYTRRGRPVILERKMRSKPSRQRTRSKNEVWARGEESGMVRRQTTEGRKRGEERRQKELGGVMMRMVK